MRPFAFFILVLTTLSIALAEPAAPIGTLTQMPVKEITVFKDGHAFMLNQGILPVDDNGNVVLDYLPTPVLGTFWPYAGKDAPKLLGVRAGQRRVTVERTALTIRELIEANIGAQIIVTETGNLKYTATIVSVPQRTGDEQEKTGVANSTPSVPQKSGLVLLRTDEGTKAVSLERIQDIVFVNAPKPLLPVDEYRNLLTLQLDWPKGQVKQPVNIGMIYLQKGIRWIPNYQVSLDGKGMATIKLQATLLNEMTDLENVTANLVVGVPTFNFKDTIDPIALQQTAAQLSPYFRQESQTAYAFSNAIMSQSARMGEYRRPVEPDGNMGDEGGAGEKHEDLFVFTVPRLSLKKGERIVVPVAEYRVPYRDVYTLMLPYAPPMELARNVNINNEQQAELARLFSAPKVTHAIRITNAGTLPLTTAPALILRDGQLLGQGMMTYTSPGADADLPITTAVDIQVTKQETETKRTTNALTLDNQPYMRIDLNGSITLTNRLRQPALLEITRYVLGVVDAAGQNGKIEKTNVLEDTQYRPVGGYPQWWGWYNWPSWWSRVNGIGNVSWKTTLAPGKSIDLKYDWHYFWR